MHGVYAMSACKQQRVRNVHRENFGWRWAQIAPKGMGLSLLGNRWPVVQPKMAS